MADSAVYISMCKTGVFNEGGTPLCYRVLQPLLASLLPFKCEVSFLVCTTVNIAICIILLYRYLIEIGIDSKKAVIGIIIFAQLDTVYESFKGAETDSIGWVFILLSILLLIKKQDILFSLCVGIGVLGRESVLFVLPLYYLANKRKGLRCVAVSIFPLLIFFGIRFFVPGPDFMNYYASEIPRLFQRRISGQWWYVAPINIYNSFRLAWVLAFLGALKNRKFIIHYLPYVFLVFIQFIFASDEKRLMSYLFPVIIPLCLYGLFLGDGYLEKQSIGMDDETKR